MCARLARAGLPRLPHEGPLTYAARAAARWPGAGGVRAIGEAYAALRYGPVGARTIRIAGAPALWRASSARSTRCPRRRRCARSGRRA